MRIGKPINVTYKGKSYDSLLALAENLGVDVSHISRLYKKYGNDLSKVAFHRYNRREDEYKNHYYVVNGNEIYTNLRDLRKKHKYPVKFLSEFIKTCPRKKKNKIWYYDLTNINTYRRKSLIKVGNIIANKEILEVLDDNEMCKVRCLNCNNIYFTTGSVLRKGKRVNSHTCIRCTKKKPHKIVINNVEYNSFRDVDRAFNLNKGVTASYYRCHEGDMSNFYNKYLKKL